MELLGGPELADLVASLPGFLLAVTHEGKLVGVTDNVAQHLGHSMVGTGTWGHRGGGTRRQGRAPTPHFPPRNRWIWWHRATAFMTCWIRPTTPWCGTSWPCMEPPNQVGGIREAVLGGGKVEEVWGGGGVVRVGEWVGGWRGGLMGG